jgi:asparagine N-glycosylation enzyme membrane subunit Stt3
MNKHRLLRDENQGRLKMAGIALLVLTLVAGFFIHIHAYFPGTGFFGFQAVFGFFACAGLVLLTRLIGLIIKRRDNDHV